MTRINAEQQRRKIEEHESEEDQANGHERGVHGTAFLGSWVCLAPGVSMKARRATTTNAAAPLTMIPLAAHRVFIGPNPFP